jgi:hypothetical protein
MRHLLVALTLAAASAPAAAGWSVSADLEHFRWAEDTSPSVTETGPRFGLGLHWMQDRDAGWYFAYHGRLYFGSVNYQGAELLTDVPLSGTTDYGGMTNEAQAVYRLPGNTAGAEFVAGLGYDYWKRQLSSFQSEEYRVVYLRVGANFDRRSAVGWYGAAGVKLPLSVDEDVHFPDIGFEPNPHLKPKGEFSFYAELGYRFDERWSLTGFYDSYRFGESDTVGVIEAASGTPFNFFQPRSSVDSVGVRLRYNF